MSESFWKALQHDLNCSALPRELITAENLHAAILDWYWPLVVANIRIPLFFVLDTGFGFCQDVASRLDGSKSSDPYHQALLNWLKYLQANCDLTALYEHGGVPDHADYTSWQARRLLTQACASVFPQEKFQGGGGLLRFHPTDLNVDRLAKAWTANKAIEPLDQHIQAVVAAIEALIPETPKNQPGQRSRPATSPDSRAALAWIGDLVRAGSPDLFQPNPASDQHAARLAALDLPALTGFRCGVAGVSSEDLRMQQRRVKAHQYSEAQEGKPPTDGFDGITVGRDLQHVLASELARDDDDFMRRYLEKKLFSLRCLRRDIMPFRLLLALFIDVSPESVKVERRAQSICREWGGLFLQDALMCLNTLLTGRQKELRLEIALDACVLTRYQSEGRMLVSQSAVLSKMSGGPKHIDTLRSLRHLEGMARQGWPLPQEAINHPRGGKTIPIPMPKFMQFDAGEALAGSDANAKMPANAAKVIRCLFRVSGRTIQRPFGAAPETHPYHLAIVISAMHSGHDQFLDAIHLAKQESIHTLALSKDGAQLNYRSPGGIQVFSTEGTGQDQSNARKLFLSRMISEIERAIKD